MISIIIPAYRSHDTIVATLRSLLAQSRLADEIIVVDSSSDEATCEVVQPFLGAIHYVRSAERLFPHAARNRGVAISKGDLLVFTDPDVVAHPDWLARLEHAHQGGRPVVVGAVDCYGRRWLDVGVHLCKFDSWLPGGKGRPIAIGPTVNMSVTREAFEAVGGFDANSFLADTTLSWALTAAGYPLWFEPEAIVRHDHQQRLSGLFRERFMRGRDFGQIRVDDADWSPFRIAVWWLFSISLIRLVSLVARRVRFCAAAGWLGWLAVAWPIVVVGEAGWLWGEASAYRALLRRRS